MQNDQFNKAESIATNALKLSDHKDKLKLKAYDIAFRKYCEVEKRKEINYYHHRKEYEMITTDDVMLQLFKTNDEHANESENSDVDDVPNLIDSYGNVVD